VTSSTNELPAGVLDDLVDALDAEGEVAKQALTRLLEAAIENLGANESSILLPVDQDHLKFYVSSNPRILQEDIPLIPVRDSIAGVVFLTGQSMVQAEGHNPVVDKQLGYATKEYMALPIVHSDQVVGVLTFVNRPEGMGSFSKDEIDFADSVSEMCEPLIEHAEQVRRNIASTVAELRRRFSGSDVTSDGFFQGPDMAASESYGAGIRTMIAAKLQALDEADLELVRDIIDRFAAQVRGGAE
jgi:GAF domain-containing protein